MKTFLLICASACMAVSAFATGNEGVNPPQSGVLNFSAATGLVQTNQFAFPYQTAPLVIVNGLLTNNNPFTVSGITTTNFILTVTTGATTNASVAWQSFVGGTRMESGSVITGGGTNQTVTFPYPYATIPVVVSAGGGTNTVQIASTLITTTNFAIQTASTSTNQWISIGTVQNPPSENTGQFPPSNKVIY